MTKSSMREKGFIWLILNHRVLRKTWQEIKLIRNPEAGADGEELKLNRNPEAGATEGY